MAILWQLVHIEPHMSKNKNLALEVKKWSSQVGKDIAFIQLMKSGLSLSLAEKLVFGNYKHKLGRMTSEAITKAMWSLPYVK